MSVHSSSGDSPDRDPHDLSPSASLEASSAPQSPAASEPGTELSIDVRGTRIPATVTTLPFYRRNS